MLADEAVMQGGPNYLCIIPSLRVMQGFGVTDTKGPLSVEVTEESELAQVKQLQALTKSQQRQILEHQEALARLHAMIRETQEAQVGKHLFVSLRIASHISDCTPWFYFGDLQKCGAEEHQDKLCIDA